MGNTAYAIGTLGIGPLVNNLQEQQTQTRQLLTDQKAQQDKLLQEAKDQAAKQKQDEQDAAQVSANRQKVAGAGSPYGTGGGFRSTILTGPLGLPNTPSTAPKTLLGS